MFSLRLFLASLNVIALAERPMRSASEFTPNAEPSSPFLLLQFQLLFLFVLSPSFFVCLFVSLHKTSKILNLCKDIGPQPRQCYNLLGSIQLRPYFPPLLFWAYFCLTCEVVLHCCCSHPQLLDEQQDPALPSFIMLASPKI